MGDNQVAEPSSPKARPSRSAKEPPVTPGDDAVPKRRRHPTKGRRSAVFKDGKDYCVYAIAQPQSDLPEGSLIPLPNVPRFDSQVAARKWVTTSGDQLAGQQYAVLRLFEIGMVVVESKPQITVNVKPKFQRAGPEVESESA